MLRNKGAALAVAVLATIPVAGRLYSYLSPFNNHYRYEDNVHRNPASTESVQDISAETIAYYTKVLAWFTVILAGASVIQGWMLIRADATLKDHAAQLKRASDFTETQNAIISAQTDIQQKQHAIGRLQFLATHRPKLIVRHVQIEDFGARFGLPTEWFSHEEEVKGGLVVVNIGGSEATIIDARYRIFCS